MMTAGVLSRSEDIARAQQLTLSVFGHSTVHTISTLLVKIDTRVTAAARPPAGRSVVSLHVTVLYSR